MPRARPRSPRRERGGREPALDADAKLRLRFQARDWLMAELSAWTKVIENGPDQAKAPVVLSLEHWQKDADLAGIREADSLKTLPEAERKDWKALWVEVGALLGKARAQKP
jgi:hypothetical protein